MQTIARYHPTITIYPHLSVGKRATFDASHEAALYEYNNNCLKLKMRLFDRIRPRATLSTGVHARSRQILLSSLS